MSAADWLVQARTRLSGRSETPVLEARALLEWVTGRSRAWWLAHPEHPLHADEQTRLASLLDRLAGGVPLPYLTGEQEFFGLPFGVTPAVLIPRPETELLVEQAIAWLKTHPTRRRAVDVGTGSGCIAISLAVQIPTLQVVAVDLSPDALKVSRANATRHAVLERMDWVRSDLLSPFAGGFDLVCANLPYIPSADLERLPAARHEPWTALDGGPDGFVIIRRLLEQLPALVRPGSLALLELEDRQGQAALEAAVAIPKATSRILKDAAGLDRLLRIDFQDGGA